MATEGSDLATEGSNLVAEGSNLVAEGSTPVDAGAGATSAGTFLGGALAALARRVENEFVGMACGIMDQFAVSVGRPGDALFLNTRTLDHSQVPLPRGHRLIVIHSGVSHKLTEDGYATRVAECNSACRHLGIDVLSDLTSAELHKLDKLPDIEKRRARHILTENQRVLDGIDALNAGDVQLFGALMVGSHISQRDDFEVSVPEVDQLVDAAMDAGAIGARLTGGGFGGSIVVLAQNEDGDAIAAAVHTAFPRTTILT